MAYEIRTTETFAKWFKKLKDRTAKIRIQARFDRVEQGNFGDVKSIDESISEMRLFFGPGYRIYYTVKDNVVVVLLIGGDKSSQTDDIAKARTILDELKEGET